MTHLYSELTGSGNDLLVLLHGLGATADIWSPLLATRPARWEGRVLVLDLPGHGASDTLDSYDMPTVASAVSAEIRNCLGDAGCYRVLGHSYGGVVALELGRLQEQAAPDFVYGLGIKSVWTEQEVQGMRSLAHKPPRLFTEAGEAAAWYRKIAGLSAVETSVGCTGRGIKAADAGRWSLAVDPLVHAIAAVDMGVLADANRGRFALAYGALDKMVSAGDLARYDPAVTCLASGGHNIMVENPGAVWAWLVDLAD